MQIALYSRLATEVLNRRAAKQYDQESLKLAGKLLEQNPELYTIWNYRREALQSKLQVRQTSTAYVAADTWHAYIKLLDCYLQACDCVPIAAPE